MAMLNHRLPLGGLLAVLLALMAQLGVGATVPQVDPIAINTGAHALCQTLNEAGGKPAAPAPWHGPDHPPNCQICPLCIALHASAAALVSAAAPPPPSGFVVLRGELSPPSTAPPALRRAPNQPRAPPTYA
jgi:hypothetical protein